VEWFVAHNIATLAELIQNALQQREKESIETQMHYSMLLAATAVKGVILKVHQHEIFCITNIAGPNTTQYVRLGSPVLQTNCFVMRNYNYLKKEYRTCPHGVPPGPDLRSAASPESEADILSGTKL
jgi:hypothetical protein